MINTQKVELMCRAALYEKTEGREPLKIKKRYNESFSGGTFSIVIPAVAAYSLLMFLITAAVTKGSFDLPSDLATIIILLVCFVFLGVLFVVAYHSISIYMIGRRYENVRCSMRRYEIYKERIEKMNSAAEEDTGRGDE